MRKILLLSSTLLILTLLSFSTGNTQKKSFEGVITYTLLNHGAPQPPRYELYIKGSKWRREMPSGINNTIYIGDTNAPEKIILLRELLGHKFLILNPFLGTPQTRHVIDSIRRRPNHFIYASETKVIAGYTCKKLYVRALTMGRKQDTILVPIYYTGVIPDYFSPLDFPGLPMQIRTFPPDSNSTYQVTSVIEKSLPDSLFVATPSYRPIRPEDGQRIHDSLMNAR